MASHPFQSPTYRSLLLVVLVALVSSLATAPLTAAEKMGKPPKVTWTTGCRLTEADLMDGSATIGFTSDQAMEQVSVGATPSLNPYLTLDPTTIDGVVPGVENLVTVTLNDPENLPEQTLGGTIKVRYGGKTLAKPCSVSIKNQTDDEDPEDGEEDDPEGEDPDEEDDEEVNTLTWDPDVIDESFFAEGLEAIVSFTSEKDLGKVCIWVTPSAQDYLTVDPTMFPEILSEEGSVYEILLTLSMPVAELPHELGGTVHVRQCDDTGKMRRTYDPPIGILVGMGEDEEPPEAEPEIIVSSADFEMGSISANEIITVFGNGLGDEAKGLASSAGNTQVLIDGLAAPILFNDSEQLNTIVPSGVAGRSNVAIRVTNGGKVSAPYVVSVEESSPALYSLDGSGAGQGAILNSDLTVNSPTNRADRDSWIALYGTGGGAVETDVEDGTILTESIPLSQPVEVTINGISAEVLWAGYPAGSVLGVVQVNVMIPTDPRIVFGVYPVVLKVGDNESNGAVTVAIK